MYNNILTGYSYALARVYTPCITTVVKLMYDIVLACACGASANAACMLLGHQGIVSEFGLSVYQSVKLVRYPQLTQCSPYTIHNTIHTHVHVQCFSHVYIQYLKFHNIIAPKRIAKINIHFTE